MAALMTQPDTQLQILSWEYDFDSDVPAPMEAILVWVQDMLASSLLRWDECRLIDTRSGLRAEMLAPGGRRDRRKWLQSSLTRTHSLLLILGDRPAPIRHAFSRMEPTLPPETQLEAMPWSIPREAIADLIASFERAGGATIFGHDGQFMLTARPLYKDCVVASHLGLQR